MVFVSFSSCRRPPQPRAGRAARVIWLFITRHRTVCFCSFYSLCKLFCCLFGTRCELGTSPPRGTVGCTTFPFRGGFRFFVSPPAMMPVRGRVLTLVFLVIAPAFFINRFSSSRPPPHHAGGPREVFDGGLPIIAPFFVSTPSHAGCTRDVFDGGLPYCSTCIFLQLLFFAFFLAS